MKVIDTSFLVGVYSPDDEHHENAVKIAQDIKNDSAIISDVILFETLTVLNYRVGIVETEKAYREIINNKSFALVSFSSIEKQDILSLFFAKKKLSVADCSVVFLSRKHGAQIVTFNSGLKL